MIGDFFICWRMARSFSGLFPVAGRRKYDRQYSGLIDEQRNATGIVPGSRHLVLERCRDEIGDWRIILHSPYGRRVHEPWALAIAGQYMPYGALTRLWSPVMTALLRAFLTLMVNCPTPRFFV
ncbi:ATP-dependent helicase [Escherichia coli]|uniref:ATP-dependent helicase n=1 Tax=Escherichia coli TaxID=562 RepID=A0A377A194_ECOLX|nr:ATP-dependent helicase [Escherichia coli]